MVVLAGVLRVHIIEAKNLLNRDNTVIAQDVSDPYVTVDVGVTRIIKTFVLNNTLNPRWNEVFIVPVNSKARSVTFKVKDKDVMGCDMLGSFPVGVDELIEEEIISGWFPLVSPLGKQDCGRLRIEISFVSDEKKSITNNMFPFRTCNKVRLYQDACCTKFPQHEMNKRRKSIIQIKPGDSSWVDLYNDIKQAQNLIYISAHTLNPDVKLSRYTPCESLSSLLLDRAEKGVQILIIVQDPVWGSPCEENCHMHDPERHLKLRFAASTIQVSVRPPTRTDHSTSLIVLDTPQENVNEPHRNLVAYYGGMDLVTGRWDTPAHSLFDTQRTLHRGDFYNPKLKARAKGHAHCQQCGPKDGPDKHLETTTCDSTSPRLPWHDTSARVEGRLAHDLLLHFEEQWIRHGKAVDFAEIDEDEYDLESIDITNSPIWECTILKNLELPANPTSSLRRRKRTITRSMVMSDDDVIQQVLVHHIKLTKKFVYIECPVLFGVKYTDDGTLTPILNEMITRITVAIANRTEFTIFIILPETYINTSNQTLALGEGLVSKINKYNKDCIRKMYDMIGNCISKHPHALDKHPTDYFNIYTLRNNESSTPFKTLINDQNILSEMIYLHSQTVIIDDEVLILGSPTTPNQMNAKEYEVAMLLSQPGFKAEINRPLPMGDVYKFRMSLWCEHMGDTQLSWTDPSSRECRESIRFITAINRRNHQDNRKVQAHIIEFCKEVTRKGNVTFYD